MPRSREKQVALPHRHTTPDSDSHGRHAAIGVPGLRRHELDDTRSEFERLNTESARAAFADKWLSLNARALEVTWPMVYELLRVVRDRELYLKPAIDRKVTYDSFEAYFEATFGRGFQTWIDLEHTYAFAKDYAPQLFDTGYTDATTKWRILNNADKRAFIADRLQESPERSDNGIAEDLGIAPSTVRSVRRELVHAGQIIQHEQVVGRDGVRKSVRRQQFDAQIEASLRRSQATSNVQIAAETGAGSNFVTRVRTRLEQQGGDSERDCSHTGTDVSSLCERRAWSIRPRSRSSSKTPPSCGRSLRGSARVIQRASRSCSTNSSASGSAIRIGDLGNC